MERRTVMNKKVPKTSKKKNELAKTAQETELKEESSSEVKQEISIPEPEPENQQDTIASDDRDRESWLLSAKLVKWLNRFGVLLLIFLTLLYSFITITFSLSSLNLVDSDSPIFGFGFVPPYLILYLAVISAFLAVLLRKYKIVIYCVALYALFFVLLGDHSLFTSKNLNYLDIEKVVSVATLNVAQYDKTPERISSEMKKYNPDFIFLQEINVPLSVGVENTNIAFGKDYHIFIGKVCDSAILSKYPILETHELMLPSKQPGYVDNTPENQKDHINRYFLHAVVDVNGTKVNLLCLRLIAGRGQNLDKGLEPVLHWGVYLAKVQMMESELMAEYMKKLTGPIIFGGDFNASPPAPSMAILYKNWQDVTRTTKLFPENTFNAEAPNQRLDYIFCNSELTPLKTYVAPAVVSDHRIVCAALGLKKKNLIK